MMRKVVLGFLLLLGFSGFSQTLKTVKELEKTNEKCLDNEANGLQCSTEYYKQMDLLLNKVYNKLRSGLTGDEKSKLKKEQQLWIKKRDQYSETLYSETKEELGTSEGEDFKMILRHNEAEFVKKRVIELIKRL